MRRSSPALALLLTLTSCPAGAEEPRSSVDFSTLRQSMVRRQIAARGVADPAVLKAMRKVPRHRFVRPVDQARAYIDRPLAIEHGQTISQPYIVALMSELAELSPGEKVLEIGTGSGYQAAVLAELGAEVYSIEISKPLAASARARLAKLGYTRIHLRQGDGFAGWPEVAPFDAIVVTAAPPEIPPPLLKQLAVGGKLVIPVGRAEQELVVVTRNADGLQRRSVIPVLFVPMTGEAQRR